MRSIVPIRHKRILTSIWESSDERGTPVQRFRNSNHIALIVGWAKSPGTADVTTPGATRFCPRGPTRPRVPTAWAKRTRPHGCGQPCQAPWPTLGFMEIYRLGRRFRARIEGRISLLTATLPIFEPCLHRMQYGIIVVAG